MKKNEMYTDTQILNGIKNNDSKVVSYVYATYYPVVRGVVYSMCEDFDNVEDLFQDAMLILYEQADKLELRCALKTYVCGIAKNLVFNENRRRCKLSSIRIEECYCCQRETSIEEEYNIDVEREAILNHYLRQMPATDIEKYKTYIDRKPVRIAPVKYRLQKMIRKDKYCNHLKYQ